MKTFHIYLLPGDGIGPEIAEQAKKIFKVLRERGAADLRVKEGVIGGASVDLHGVPLTSETLKTAQRSDAVLMGAVGGPKWDTAPREVRPERGLLAIRKEMGLFANLRPAVVFDELAEASTLKTELVKGLDILIIRELTGDLYFGQPRGVEELPDGQKRGINTMVYTTSEIRRIAETAFEAALKRGGRVCSIDKANVLECTELWRNEVIALHAERYADRVELSHMYVDNAAMQLVRYPRQFDVMLTGNMFGDILSDCASMLTGSLGMLPSASLGEPGKPGLYEPVHGSAPDIAGRNVANPMAMILSAAMMMRYSLGLGACADATEAAVRKTLAKGLRTQDIACGGEAVTTDQAGDEIAAELNRILRGF